MFSSFFPPLHLSLPFNIQALMLRASFSGRIARGNADNAWNSPDFWEVNVSVCLCVTATRVVEDFTHFFEYYLQAVTRFLSPHYEPLLNFERTG